MESRRAVLSSASVAVHVGLAYVVLVLCVIASASPGPPHSTDSHRRGKGTRGSAAGDSDDRHRLATGGADEAGGARGILALIIHLLPSSSPLILSHKLREIRREAVPKLRTSTRFARTAPCAELTNLFWWRPRGRVGSGARYTCSRVIAPYAREPVDLK